MHLPEEHNTGGRMNARGRTIRTSAWPIVHTIN